MREIELQRHVAEGYRLCYGAPFARIFQQLRNEELPALLPEMFLPALGSAYRVEEFLRTHGSAAARCCALGHSYLVLRDPDGLGLSDL